MVASTTVPLREPVVRTESLRGGLRSLRAPGRRGDREVPAHRHHLDRPASGRRVPLGPVPNLRGRGISRVAGAPEGPAGVRRVPVRVEELPGSPLHGVAPAGLPSSTLSKPRPRALGRSRRALRDAPRRGRRAPSRMGKVAAASPPLLVLDPRGSPAATTDRPRHPTTTKVPCFTRAIDAKRAAPSPTSTSFLTFQRVASSCEL